MSEVENRIAKINQSEALKAGQDITQLLNEALEDSIFIFRKTGESQLDLAANSFKTILFQLVNILILKLNMLILQPKNSRLKWIVLRPI